MKVLSFHFLFSLSPSLSLSFPSIQFSLADLPSDRSIAKHERTTREHTAGGAPRR
jgi:hypothetical protein